MHNDRVARLNQPHSSTDLMDPARILVAKNIRQGTVHLCPPDALNNVQVRATESCATNAHNHIVGLLKLRIRKFLKLKKLFSFQRFIKCMESSCSHSLFLSAAVLWQLLSGDPYTTGWACVNARRNAAAVCLSKSHSENIDKGEAGCHGKRQSLHP